MLPCDRDGLWMKAKAHINRSFASREAGDFSQAALWAASALELLGKSALAKVSPLLVADPQDNGRSLLIAANLSSEATRFKSIPAKALFSRCARAFRPFNDDEAGRIASQRNDELHSAIAPFVGLDEDLWWERYWSQAVILIHAQDEDVSAFVGASREADVEAHLARNAENVQRRVEAMIGRARRRSEAAEQSEDSRLEIVALVSRGGYAADFSSSVDCPACGELGLLMGDDVLESEVEYDVDEGGPLEYLTVGVDAFECEGCGLRLHGYEYIVAAQLPEDFEDEREYEVVYDDYGNE